MTEKQYKYNLATEDFHILLDESITPQGLINVTSINKDSITFSISYSNKTFNTIAGLDPLSKQQSIEYLFQFLDGFNTSTIKQFYLSEETEASFIYDSEESVFKLNLKKVNNIRIIFSIDNLSNLQVELNAKKQQLAEQQNEEYRLFLETIMENLPVSLFAKTTPDLEYLYWNKTIEDTTGISADSAIGKTDLELLKSKQIAEQYHNEDLNLLKYGIKLEGEHEFTNAQGEIKQFKTIKTLHKSNIGNPLILGISMDITKLKEVEKQLEQSTNMLKEAQIIAKLGYWEYDIKRDLLFDNSENRKILGIDNTTHFINSNQFKELFHTDDQDMISHAFKRCIVNKSPNSGIVRIDDNNIIRYIFINYRPIENSTGNIDKIRGTCLDITEIRNPEISIKNITTS